MKSKINTSLISILAILSFSTFIPALAYAAEPLAISDKDWIYPGANSWNQGFSPQTQINKDNVEDLEVKWVFPVASKASAPAGLQSVSLSDGLNTPPVVVDGTVFAVTNFLKLYALDAKTGRQKWSYDYNVDIEAEEERLPLSVGGVHLHSFRAWIKGNVILLPGIACDFVGVDMDSGQESFRVKDLCLGVDGDAGIAWSSGGAFVNAIGTYEKGNQFIYALGWPRSHAIGIDMDTKNVIWRVFNVPPLDRLTPDWALQDCDKGYFGLPKEGDDAWISCSEAAAVNMKGFEYDWQASPDRDESWDPNPMLGIGTGAMWGVPIVDEDTGLVIFASSQDTQWPNATFRPGPNLYGSTWQAIDADTGQRAWWIKPFGGHELWDYDCNWSALIVDHPTLGKVVMKGCKDGFLFLVKLETGEPIWSRDIFNDVPDERTIFGHDPRLYEDMTEKWPDYNKGITTEHIRWVPGFIHGSFISDLSYHDDTIFHWTAAITEDIATRNILPGPGRDTINLSPFDGYLTARDIVTGEVKWTWHYTFSMPRSSIVISADMVWTGLADGFIKFFDEDTGALLHEVNVGGAVWQAPVVGANSDGESMIFTSVGGGLNRAAYDPNLGPWVPGTVIGIGLSERAAAEVKTTTVTSTTTSRTTLTSTTTSVSTTTATTTQTVTSTTTRVSTTTATSTTTLATTSTVVSTAAPSTTTVTSQLTETVGLPATVTYAAVAVAVIAIIGAAVLATRRR